MRRRWLAFLCWGALSGCGFLDAPGSPTLVAFRLGPDVWPESSRSALHECVLDQVLAIHAELAITADGVVVLSRGPTLDPSRCTLASGEPLGAPVDLRQLTWTELRSRYRCGGLPDPNHPDATVFSETVLDLGEMLDILDGDPRATVELEIPAEVPREDARSIIDVVATTWIARGVPNPLGLISSDEAVLGHVREIGFGARMLLRWPASDDVGSAWLELGGSAGTSSPVAAAEHAHADGLVLDAVHVRRTDVDSARTQALRVEISGAAGEDALALYCRWPVEALWVDDPRLPPCP